MKTTAFTTTDVKALIEGRKTRFNKVMKPQPEQRENESVPGSFGTFFHGWNLDHPLSNPNDYMQYGPFKPGDKVGIKEAWAAIYWCGLVFHNFAYKVDNGLGHQSIKWRSPVTMPPEAIRIYVEITEVKAEKNESGVWEWVYSFAPATKGERG